MTVFARGNSAALVMRRQADFKTPEADAAGKWFQLPFYSYGVRQSEQTEEDPALYGDDHPGEIVRGLQDLAGQLEVPLELQSIGWHLAGLFGLPVTTGPGPDYSHAFAAGPIQDRLAHSAGISHANVDLHFKQLGLTYAGMTLSARKNGSYMRASFDVIGYQEDGTQAAAVDATPILFTPARTPIGFEGAVYKDAALADDVTGFDLTISKGVTADQEILNQSPYAEDSLSGRWSINGSFQTRFAAKNWYNTPDALITAELRFPISASLSLIFFLRNVQVAKDSIEVTGPEILNPTFNFQVGRPPAGQDPLTVTLVNQQANYANIV